MKDDTIYKGVMALSGRATPPCIECSRCCSLPVALHETDRDSLPLDRSTPNALMKRPDGTCVLLGDFGCTVHSTAPFACQQFDCAYMARQMAQAGGLKGLMRRVDSPQGRRELAVVAKGLELLSTGYLPEEKTMQDIPQKEEQK